MRADRWRNNSRNPRFFNYVFITPRVPQEVLVDGEVKDGKLKLLGATFVLPEAMKTFDGKYTVTIPTKAVSIGGKIKSKLLRNENINQQVLSHFKSGKTYLFGLDLPEGKEGEVTLDIDLKQITLTDIEGVRVAPVASYNSLTGTFTRENVVVEREVNGKVKKVKDFIYKFIIEGCEINCPEEIAKRILSGTDKSIYKKELEFRFAPDGVSVSETGICAQVESVLDYGTEKFAKCKVGENTVTVKVAPEFAEETIYLMPDTLKLSIIEKQRDIRLI